MVYIKTQTKKLKKGNYQPLKYRMSYYFMGKSQWGLALGIDVKLHANTENSNEHQRRAIKKWKDKDSRVILILY